jgi:hypothetical protein
LFESLEKTQKSISLEIEVIQIWWKNPTQREQEPSSSFF